MIQQNNIEYFKIFSSTCKKTSITILVIGAFHGDEPQGNFLIRYFLKLQDFQLNTDNNFIFVPVLNKTGLEKKQRKNINGVDLNRNFPTKNWVLSDINTDFYGGPFPASEEETRFIIDIIENYKPGLIISFHAPFKIVNYDGPATQIAKEISEILKLPLQADIGYPTPGSFGTYCGIERNIPTVTIELDEHLSEEKLWMQNKPLFEYLLNLKK